jgi:threonine synthase
VPAAIGDFLILGAIAASDGFACSVADADIIAAQQRVAREEGLLLCPEGAATVAAYAQALENDMVSPEERAVLFNCGSGLKYPMPPADETIDHRRPVNWAAMA